MAKKLEPEVLAAWLDDWNNPPFFFGLFFFFFQAEDGIRDLTVTGVQTCALPICPLEGALHASHHDLGTEHPSGTVTGRALRGHRLPQRRAHPLPRHLDQAQLGYEIGRASCRERV